MKLLRLPTMTSQNLDKFSCHRKFHLFMYVVWRYIVFEMQTFQMESRESLYKAGHNRY